jgi:hypothetical protein
MRFERTGDAPAERASSHARAARGIAEKARTRSAYPQSCTARSMVKNITLSFVVA